MPVDFHCPRCQRGIRAPDQAIGQTMRCPNCNSGVMVPYPGMHLPGMGPDGSNPPAPAGGPVPKMPLRQKPVLFPDVFGTSGKLLAQKGGLIAGMLVVTALIEIVIMALLTGLTMLIIWSIASRLPVMRLDMRISLVVSIALIPLSIGVIVACMSYMIMGLIKAVTSTCRGQASFVDLFLPGKCVLWGALYMFLYLLTLYAVTALIAFGAAALSWLVTSMLVGMKYDPASIAMYLRVIIGAASLLIAAVNLMATLNFLLTLFFIADRDMNINDAMMHSVKYMGGNKMQTFLVLLATNVLTSIGMTAAGFIGGVGAVGLAVVLLLISYAFTMITMTVVYLRATGQLTCADEAPAPPRPQY
ncbi:hypothetical protein [Lignipirellula cremea]|uniref:Uncharacterized protein n=1 Tax=Lignipirellula cremea TaxID=2528010 RepID=A0A518DZP8_9BACT|nr:hypothetical protein [Lignipirellula cremea]QDU97320.1 hypothetical protein Pla8534_51660 [Lignipirellula cremea]